jgi:hypothetical protein
MLHEEALGVRQLWVAVAFLGWIGVLPAQVSDVSVRGLVIDDQGRRVSGTTITATHSETGLTQSTETDSQGEYYFGSLPRGLYTLKVEMAGYRGLEKQGIELAVGAKHEENFALAPIPNRGGQTEVSKFFDIVPSTPSLPAQTIASSVSVVVEENKILQLPLANRNIYSLFLLQPGVTSQGAIVRRGLSFSVHGQRVSGSNYLLDGVDNNDIVLTGPVVSTSAEAIQEFRMVNSSFSSENGRATSFVAQVVTRSGSNRFHGSLFEFLANDRLNANTFENNAKREAKPPFHQNQFGYSVGGPIAKNKTFFSSVLEFSRLHYSRTEDFALPSSLFIASLPEDSVAHSLLTEIPPLPTTPKAEDPNIGTVQYQVPNRIDTLLATERLDHHFSNAQDRLMFRYTLGSTSQERSEEADFTGYPSLRPTDRFRAHNALIDWTHTFGAGQINDFRAGWSRERVWQPRPHPDVPILQSLDFVSLPGNLRQSDQRENDNVVQFTDTFSVRRGRSALKMGFEYRRNLSNSLTLGLQNEALGGTGRLSDGFYIFPSLGAFREGQPFYFAMAVDRFSSGGLRLPNLHREYRSNEYAALIQDDLKLTRKLSLNLGLRYEYFGVPHNTNRSQDVNFYFGPGSTIEERLANGILQSTEQNPGRLNGLLYRRDLLNFAPSIGFAWDPFGGGRTVLRAGYAVALDRVFDTARDLRSNNQQLVTCFPPCVPSFLVPAERMLPNLDQSLGPAEVVQLDENLRTPYAQNWYIGVQQAVSPNFLLEIGHAGSAGRKLISRDVINRSIQGVPILNPAITDDTFLSNAGNSNYLALEVGLRRRFSQGLQYQVSYTYSHAIDNQSDIFEGSRTGPGGGEFALATFTRQFDARADRGNANFDQRHNLVFNAIWELPKPYLPARWLGWLSEGWTTSVIGTYRSGFPVTVINSTNLDPITGLNNNRVDYLGTTGHSAHFSSPPPVPRGVQWLDPDLFQPAVDHLGNLGRGAVKGPGFWNYDFALLRNFGSSDSGIRVQFRAEFYNLFNHANLSVPDSLYSDFTGSVNQNFGRAYYGLERTFSRFGDLLLENPSRRIQFGLRIQF